MPAPASWRPNTWAVADERVAAGEGQRGLSERIVQALAAGQRQNDGDDSTLAVGGASGLALLRGTTMGNHELLRSADESSDSAYVLDRELRLVHTNDGWANFARANDGERLLERWPIGAPIMGAIPAPLMNFYASGFAQVTASGDRWEHEYECSSATVFRRFRMSVYPLARDHVLVYHSLIVERPHVEDGCPANDALYSERGFINQCAHCRRVRKPGAVDRWDWVPAYVSSHISNVSHGLCLRCETMYYPG